MNAERIPGRAPPATSPLCLSPITLYDDAPRLVLLGTRSYHQCSNSEGAHATSGDRVHHGEGSAHTAYVSAATCRTGTAGWPARVQPRHVQQARWARDGAAKQRRDVGGGEADGQRRARWAACTRGVRASAVMLHGIPAGDHAPGGRARSAGGAVDEPRAAAQQRRRRKAKQHLGPTRLPNTRLPPTAVALIPVMHTAPAAVEGWAGSRASVWPAESRRDERWERRQRRAGLKVRK